MRVSVCIVAYNERKNITITFSRYKKTNIRSYKNGNRIDRQYVNRSNT